jgi:hypothetical protein
MIWPPEDSIYYLNYTIELFPGKYVISTGETGLGSASPVMDSGVSWEQSLRILPASNFVSIKSTTCCKEVIWETMLCR